MKYQKRDSRKKLENLKNGQMRPEKELKKNVKSSSIKASKP